MVNEARLASHGDVSYDKAFECDKPFCALVRAGQAAADGVSGINGLDVAFEALSPDDDANPSCPDPVQEPSISASATSITATSSPSSAGSSSMRARPSP